MLTKNVFFPPSKLQARWLAIVWFIEGKSQREKKGLIF
jgi:hypothetical protein